MAVYRQPGRVRPDVAEVLTSTHGRTALLAVSGFMLASAVVCGALWAKLPAGEPVLTFGLPVIVVAGLCGAFFVGAVHFVRVDHDARQVIFGMRLGGTLVTRRLALHDVRAVVVGPGRNAGRAGWMYPVFIVTASGQNHFVEGFREEATSAALAEALEDVLRLPR